MVAFGIVGGNPFLAGIRFVRLVFLFLGYLNFGFLGLQGKCVEKEKQLA
jgi:hypothetical protein